MKQVNKSLAIREKRTASCAESLPPKKDGSDCLATSFGAEIYRLRMEKRLSQAYVARCAQLARGYYSQIENSRRFPPPPDTVGRITQALSLDSHQAKYLQKLAEDERCAMVRLPSEQPKGVANFIRKLSLAANRISAEKLRKLEAVLLEEAIM